MRKPVTGIIVLLTLQFAVPTLCSAGAFGPFLYNQLHVFTNSPDGSQPLSLLPGPDNALYGVTYAGGSSAGGTIYRINRDGSGYAILANFSTSQTGNSNSPEYEIADGSLGSGIPGFDASSALYYYPLLGGLTVALGNDGYLYGTTFYGGTNNDGTIFKLSRTPGSDLTTLRSFGTTDANPVNVIQGNDGALYGTTFNGGANNFGAIFRLASDGSSYSVLHSFSGSLDGAKCPSLIQGSDGMLYGVLLYGTNNTATPSGGTVFRTDTNGNYVDLTNFPSSLSAPTSIMQASDGYLYITMAAENSSTGAGVYRLSTNGSGLSQVLQTTLADGSASAYPIGLVEQNGFLYGTTILGGTNRSLGSVYQFRLSGGYSDVVYNFGAATNEYPVGQLAAGSFSAEGRVLYGTFTQGYTATQNGGIFSLVVNPPLSIIPVTSSANGQTTVFWPAWAMNYVLRSTTNLSSPTWTDVTNGTQVVGVQVTNNSPATYYQLVSPGN